MTASIRRFLFPHMLLTSLLFLSTAGRCFRKASSDNTDGKLTSARFSIFHFAMTLITEIWPSSLDLFFSLQGWKVSFFLRREAACECANRVDMRSLAFSNAVQKCKSKMHTGSVVKHTHIHMSCICQICDAFFHQSGKIGRRRSTDFARGRRKC